MKDLNLTRLNTSSPYSFWRDGEIYYLKTDFDIVYAVSFDQETVRGYDTYWFNLANTSDKPSPNDKKLMLSIISVIEEFFNNNPDILLYICDTANGQQAQERQTVSKMVSWLQTATEVLSSDNNYHG